MKTLANIFLGLFIFKAVVSAPPTDSINYDTAAYDVDILYNAYDYDENTNIDQGEIEIGTVLPVVNRPILSPEQVQEETEDDEESTSKLIDGSSPQEPLSPGVQTPEASGGIPTCILCGCIRTTVYCDDHNLDTVPPLPKDTTHVYLRFNKIMKIYKNDFSYLNKLQKIDLTSNYITEIDEDAFRNLPQLDELILLDNKIRQLPELPNSLSFLDASKNRLGRKGLKQEAFKDLKDLRLLYLSNNFLDHIPIPLPENLQALHLQDNNIQEMHEDTFCNMKDYSYARRSLEDIRLDGNPINLSKTPQAFMCLPRIPVGRLV
ncbi:epiphycan [Mantella aurantiaca]